MKTSKLAFTFACAAMLAAQAFAAPEPKSAGFTADPARILTKEALPDFLRAAGYEPEKNGETYSIKARMAGMTYTINVSVSTSGNYVWLASTVNTFGDAGQIPQDVYQKLLLANQDQGPNHFAMRECPKCTANDRYSLDMVRGRENRGMTSIQFRDQVDSLLNAITETRDSWDNTRWRLR